MRASSVFIAILAACPLAAQSDEALSRSQTSRKQTMAYLEGLAKRITTRGLEETASRESWERVAEKRREELRRMLGLLPWPSRTPLNAQITGKLDRDDYVVEKIAFESMPKVYVTANLYLPKKRAGKVPAVVYVCGHAYSPYGSKAEYQRHGISLARNGYVAFILDPIQIAETFSIHHGVYSQEMYEWYALGYSPAGVETWNAMRAIDYLETRPEVDGSRIGMTGRSGGAAMTWFTAAVDPRVKAAMPVMGISTYEANLAANTQRLHCDCMFPVNSLLHDMLHQPALIAPRPLHMAHGRLDALFPVPGYTAVEEAMKKLYASYGRADAFTNTVVETDHRDSDFLREQSIRFFDKHFLNTTGRKLEMAYQNADGKDLAVFPNGPPADAQNYRVHELFIRTPKIADFGTRAAWEKRKAALLGAFKNEVFAAFPSGPVAPRVTRGGPPQAGMEVLSIEVDPGVPARALLSKPQAAKSLPAIVYIASDGDDPQAAATVLSDLRGNEAVKLVVYPRGVDEIGWTKSVWREVQRNAMHVGHTVDSMRLRDVLGAVEVLRRDPGVDTARISVMGRSTAGILGLYAAVLDPQVEQVILLDPPASHAQGPWFLNVLRHLDLPEAAGLIAPRRVNFYSRMAQPYEQARAIFSLYGKGDNLWTTTSLAGPVLHRYHHGYSSGR